MTFQEIKSGINAISHIRRSELRSGVPVHGEQQKTKEQLLYISLSTGLIHDSLSNLGVSQRILHQNKVHYLSEDTYQREAKTKSSAQYLVVPDMIQIKITNNPINEFKDTLEELIHASCRGKVYLDMEGKQVGRQTGYYIYDVRNQMRYYHGLNEAVVNNFKSNMMARNLQGITNNLDVRSTDESRLLSVGQSHCIYIIVLENIIKRISTKTGVDSSKIRDRFREGLFVEHPEILQTISQVYGQEGITLLAHLGLNDDMDLIRRIAEYFEGNRSYDECTQYLREKTGITDIHRFQYFLGQKDIQTIPLTWRY